MAWTDLNIREKSKILEEARLYNVISLPRIREAYNLYAEGGHLFGFGDWLKSLFSKEEVVQEPVVQEPAPLNFEELAVRQAYAESTLDPSISNNLKATGLYQIRPIALADYNKRTGKNYTMLDMLNADKNIEVRNYLMNDFQLRPWNVKNNPSDSVQYAKSLGAFNYGSNNLVTDLNKAKAEGIDIYNSWDWLPYLPKETQDYINFILRNLDNSKLRNQAAYDSISALKPELVKKVLGSIKSTGGHLYKGDLENSLYINKTPIPLRTFSSVGSLKGDIYTSFDDGIKRMNISDLAPYIDMRVYTDNSKTHHTIYRVPRSYIDSVLNPKLPEPEILIVQTPILQLLKATETITKKSSILGKLLLGGNYPPNYELIDSDFGGYNNRGVGTLLNKNNKSLWGLVYLSLPSNNGVDYGNYIADSTRIGLTKDLLIDLSNKYYYNKKSTGGPLYPFSFSKQIPEVRY